MRTLMAETKDENDEVLWVMETPVTLIVLCGPPACGKSTVAKKLKEEMDWYEVVSSDDIRKELYGDEAIQGDSKAVFSVVYSRITELLERGNSVVFDATNVQIAHRRKIVQIAGDLCDYVFCGQYLVHADSAKELLERNYNRDRQVPEQVILRMLSTLKKYPPNLAEGYDGIFDLELLPDLIQR